MTAAFAGHVEVMKILLERGADIRAKTGNGATALLLVAGYRERQ